MLKEIDELRNFFRIVKNLNNEKAELETALKTSTYFLNVKIIKMKKTLTKNQAVDALLEDDNVNWSLEGAEAIVEYLEQMEEDLGEEFEFDIVAIRCEFSEMSIDEVLENYEIIEKEFEERKKEEEYDEEELKNLIKEILEDYTVVIEVNKDTVIIQDF